MPTLFLLAQSCNMVTVEDKFDAESLLGKWEDRSQEVHFVEEWSEAEDGLVGKGYVIAAGDTVFIEYLQLREVNGVLTYFAQVSDKGKGQVVPFGLKENKDSTMVFENPQHDFPQRIIYSLENDSMMRVYIEGMENGVFRKRILSYLKKDT